MVERMHRTLLDENFRVKGRTKWYEINAEMQADLDDFLAEYSKKRTLQGRYMNGRAQAAVFRVGLTNTTNKEKSQLDQKPLKGGWCQANTLNVHEFSSENQTHNGIPQTKTHGCLQCWATKALENSR